MSFHVVVDSCCDLTPEMRGSELFHSVPLTISVGDSVFRDDADLDTQILTDAMAMCQEASHTSCPSPADYLSAYERYEGDLYVVTLSAALSGSYNSAWQASRLFLEDHPGRNIHVFNSRSASSGETLIAAKAAHLAAGGLSFAEVVRETEAYIRGMNTLFVLENLDNLRKGGRLTRVQALLTNALRVKLVMGSTPEGEICKHGQALSVRQALNKLVEIVSRDESHRGKVFCISHCLCRERAEQLSMLVKKSCDFSKVLITDTRGISSFYANTGGIVTAY